MKKFLIGLVIVLIIIIAGTYYLWLSRKVDNVVKMAETTQVSENVAPVTNTVTDSDWKTYKDDKYGFELKLPFKEYKTKTFSSSDGDSILFYATTSDSNWKESILPKGYATFLTLRVMPIDKWNEMVKTCLIPELGDPSCPVEKNVGARINGYVIENRTDNSGILYDSNPNFFIFRRGSEYLKANLKPLQ